MSMVDYSIPHKAVSYSAPFASTLQSRAQEDGDEEDAEKKARENELS